MAQPEHASEAAVNSINLYSNNISAEPIDIKDFILNFNIYEDLNQNMVSGEITIADMYDLPSVIPLVGLEKIVFDIQGYQSENRKLTFAVYKKSASRYPRTGVQVYTLYFTSPEKTKDLTTLISKSYVDRTYTDIAKDIIIKVGATINVEDSTDKRSLIIPNWHPFEAINWLAQRAYKQNKNSKFASYIFFQDGRQQYNFITLDKLISDGIKSPAGKFETLQFEFGNSAPNKNDGRRYILERVIRCSGPALSTLQYISSGVYATRTITHNIIRKQITEENFKYNQEEFDKHQHLADQMMLDQNGNSFGIKYQDSPDAKLNLIPIHKTTDAIESRLKADGTKVIDASDTKDPRPVGQRAGDYITPLMNSFNVLVPGNFNIVAGNVIDLDLWYGQTKQEKLTGKFLIKSIRHRIVQHEGIWTHLSYMECCKDSFRKTTT